MIEEKRLPVGWAWTSLSQVAELNPGIDVADVPSCTPVSFVRMAAVQEESGQIDVSQQRPLDEVRRGYTSFQDGDVLFAKITPCMENGKSAVARNLISGIGYGSTEFHVLRPAPGINADLLRYYLVRQSFRQTARSHMTGTAGQLRVPAAYIAEVKYPIAPASEQYRIVEAIEQQFTRLDAGVAALKRAQAALKRYRASVLKAAVEGKLTETWRAAHPDFEPASKLLERILAERRAKWEAGLRAMGKDPTKAQYEEPTGPDTTGLPQLPDGWCWAKLGQVAAFQNGRPFPSKEYAPSGTKLLRPGNLFADGSVRWTESNTRSMPNVWAERNPDLLVRHNELVMNLTAQSLKDEFLGRVCLTGSDERCLLNQRLARITPMSGLDTRYILHTLKSAIFRRFVDRLNTGSLIQHMFTSQLDEFSFPLPPLDEQEQIVGEVERRISVVNELEAAVEANLKRAERLRQSILERAFSGQLVPQDPSEEPASTLLERLRRERDENVNGHRGGVGRGMVAINRTTLWDED